MHKTGEFNGEGLLSLQCLCFKHVSPLNEDSSSLRQSGVPRCCKRVRHVHSQCHLLVNQRKHSLWSITRLTLTWPQKPSSAHPTSFMVAAAPSAKLFLIALAVATHFSKVGENRFLLLQFNSKVIQIVKVTLNRLSRHILE